MERKEALAVVALPALAAACASQEVGLSDHGSDTVTDPTTTLAPESTTTTEAPEGLTDDQLESRQKLIDAGYDPEAVAELIDIVTSDPLIDADDCVVMVQDAFEGGRKEATDKGYIFEDAEGTIRVNTQASTTAGQGLILNGESNLFTDSNAAPFRTDSLIVDRSDVSEYYGDAEHVEQRYETAMETAFMRMCTDRYELASGIVLAANATIGSTGVRIGEFDEGVLGEYLIDGELTKEAIDEMIAEALDRYTVTEDELSGEDVPTVKDAEITEAAYEAQLTDAARLALLLERLAGEINTGTITIDASTVVPLGHDEDENARLVYSDQPIDTTESTDLGGSYVALPGEAVIFTGEFKGGCVPLNGLALNLLDGRYGYVAVTSQPEGCEPITVVTTTTTTTTPRRTTTTTTTVPETTTTTTITIPESTTTTTTTVPEGRKSDPADITETPDTTTTTTTEAPATTTTTEAPEYDSDPDADTTPPETDYDPDTGTDGPATPPPSTTQPPAETDDDDGDNDGEIIFDL